MKLTTEQQAVVNHPRGYNGRIVAVPGSGKTTTLSELVKSLVRQGARPNRIQVLMFNVGAKDSFKEKLAPTTASAVAVNTFHSLAISIVNAAARSGKAPQIREVWEDGKIQVEMQHVVRDLELNLDVAEAISVMGQWKAEGIAPQDAGHSQDDNLSIAYAEFEIRRARAGAMTFADMIPSAISLAQRGQFDYILVDEFQDVNAVQVKLLQAMAGRMTDVIVAADDDQCIYEFRSARSSFLHNMHDFFPGKIKDYVLSKTFRFGDGIATAANTIIRQNRDRMDKEIVSNGTDSDVYLVDNSEQLSDVIVDLVVNQNVAPTQVRIIGRTYAQMNSLQKVFCQRNIPFTVLGRRPFFQLKPASVLMNYLRLGKALDEPTNIKLILSIINEPGRRIPFRMVKEATRGAETSRQALDMLVNGLPQYLQAWAVGFRTVVTGISSRSAGEELESLADALDYDSHFAGQFEAFLQYAQEVHLGISDFLKLVEALDPGLGAPNGNKIVFSTVFREKGCEYDYVVIPECKDGFMPFHRALEVENQVFDTSGRVMVTAPSDPIEAERRLFYVALTRARKAVYLGTKGGRFVREMISQSEVEQVPEPQNVWSQVVLDY